MGKSAVSHADDHRIDHLLHLRVSHFDAHRSLFLTVAGPTLCLLRGRDRCQALNAVMFIPSRSYPSRKYKTPLV